MNRSILPGPSHQGEGAHAPPLAEPFAQELSRGFLRTSFLPEALRGLLDSILCALTGKVRVTGWMNIYRSGYYHRAGKPNMYDRHPGDLYPTRAAALAEIQPKHLYVSTVPVSWWEDYLPHVNSASSAPVPVVASRRVLARESGEYIDGVWTPQAELDQGRAQKQRERVLELAYSNPIL